MSKERKKIQSTLRNSLYVLGIKSAEMNALLQANETDKIKDLLAEKLLLISTQYRELGPEKFREAFDPDLKVQDMSSIHEAFQILTEEYVENHGKVTTNYFLSIEQIKANHQRRGSLKSNSSSRRGSLKSNTSSRRGSLLIENNADGKKMEQLRPASRGPSTPVVTSTTNSRLPSFLKTSFKQQCTRVQNLNLNLQAWQFGSKIKRRGKHGTIDP